MQNLDVSHKCLLEHWESFLQMKQCAEQIDAYLVEVAQRVIQNAVSKFGLQFSPDDCIIKNEYFQFIPVRIEKWKGSTRPLIALGIESVRARSVLYPTPDYSCSAYGYSPYRADRSVSAAATANLTTAVQAPEGYEWQLDFPDRGYLFRKPLPTIDRDSFCDSRKIEAHFSTAITPLLEWYLQNEEALLKAAT